MHHSHEQLGLSLQGWSEYKQKDFFECDGRILPGMYSRYFECTSGGDDLSMGRFFHGENELYRAWGRKQDVHCGFHMIMNERNIIGPIPGCPDTRIETSDGDLILILRANGQDYCFPISY